MTQSQALVFGAGLGPSAAGAALCAELCPWKGLAGHAKLSAGAALATQQLGSLGCRDQWGTSSPCLGEEEGRSRGLVGAELDAKWEGQELHSCCVGSPTARGTGMCDVLMQHTPHRITEDLGLGGTPGDHAVQPPAQAGSPGAGDTGTHPGGFRMS